MPGVYKRKTDRDRGKAGKWTLWYIGPDGKRKTRAGTTDKAISERLARELEEAARLEREGLVDPVERRRRDESIRPIADQIAEYRQSLESRSSKGTRHAQHSSSAIKRLLAAADMRSLADLDIPRIETALSRITASGKSARTRNHSLKCLKAFFRWLYDSERIAEVPRGLRKVPLLNEDADIRHPRRALTREETARLLVATEGGQPLKTHPPVPGSERALAYRIALGTGFRAAEVRSLTIADCRLEEPAPTITIRAEHAKNGRTVAQPISRELASVLRVRAAAAASPAERVVMLMPRRMVRMIRRDLKAAGIPYKTADGYVDFHALRSTYVTRLAETIPNIKVVQVLARHSDVNLTIRRYAKATDDRLREGVDKAFGIEG